jgi:hypothetical protein
MLSIMNQLAVEVGTMFSFLRGTFVILEQLWGNPTINQPYIEMKIKATVDEISRTLPQATLNDLNNACYLDKLKRNDEKQELSC